MENLKKLENMVSESDKTNLEESLGAVVEAVLANADGKNVDIEGKSKKLVEVIDNIFDREIDKLVAKNITLDTLNSMMISAIKNAKNGSLKDTLDDSCNIAYFKLAQKDKELKARNVNLGALSASVENLKPRYLENANAEFAKLLENTLEKVRTDFSDNLIYGDVENIADVINAILTQCYEEKYRNLVEKKYAEIEELEANEEDGLTETSQGSKADGFVSKLDSSLNKVVNYCSSIFYEPDSFMVTKAVNCSDKLESKIDKSLTDSGFTSLTLPKFITLVMGTNLSPVELKAAQNWLNDKNVETYDAIADSALKRK